MKKPGKTGHLSGPKAGERAGQGAPFFRLGPPGQGMLETILCATLVDSQQGERLVVLTSQITPVGSTVEALRAELVCISAILLVFALVLALWVSRKVTGPIVRINQAAKELGKGRFDVNFGSGGYREIDELSATMTEAAEALGRQDHLRRELLANVSHQSADAADHDHRLCRGHTGPAWRRYAGKLASHCR